MSTAQERATARNEEARAAASKRARELEKAQALINQRRSELIEALTAARDRERAVEESLAELSALRAQVQGLAYLLNGPPFYLTSTELAPLVGRSRQKVDYWLAHELGVTPQAEDPAAPPE